LWHVLTGQGKYWKGLDSIVVSHVADETGAFVPKFINNETGFRQFLKYLIPQDDLDLVRELIAIKYSNGDVRNRTATLLRDPFFTCNTRQLIDAYNDIRGHYMMQYNFLSWFGLAVHASDLLALFWNEDFDVGAIIAEQYPSTPQVIIRLVSATFGVYAQQYQSYYVSHAISRSPNEAKVETLPVWSVANTTEDGLVGNVMEAGFSLFGNYFNNRSVDSIVAKSTCDFWAEIAEFIEWKYSPRQKGRFTDISNILQVQS
jgi:carboxylesterase type B